MLYDESQLARVYLHAWQLTGNGFFRTITEEILDYVAREMRSPEGGFYSTQDADSEGLAGRRARWLPALPGGGPGLAQHRAPCCHAPAGSWPVGWTTGGLCMPQFHLPGADYGAGGAAKAVGSALADRVRGGLTFGAGRDTLTRRPLIHHMQSIARVEGQ
jgi:hypothetical protein